MRILLVFLYVVGFFLIESGKSKRINNLISDNPKHAYQLGNDVVRRKFKNILRISGVTVVTKGFENLPDKTALYVGNHRSYFDILTTHVILNRPVGFVAKSEMTKVPFLAQWMQNIGCLFLDRKDNKKALKTILDGVTMLKEEQVSLYIFPEGTRGHTDEIAPFKKGSFKMAEKSGVPIVPIGIVNSDKVFENNGWFRKIRSTKVYINIGEPIYTNNLDNDEKKHIDVHIQKVVAELIQELKTEYSL